MGRRVAAILRAAVALYVVAGIITAFGPGRVEGLLTGEAATSSPVPQWAPQWVIRTAVVAGSAVLAPLLVLVALTSLIIRFRRHSGDERHQVTWVLAGAGYAMVTVPLDPVLRADGVLFVTGLVALPLTIGVAMVRLRLYAVDVVVNRTLVFVAVSGGAALAYMLAVAVVDAIVGGRAPLAASAAVAGCVALALIPVYLRLQRAINIVTFGSADDPRILLRMLGSLLETSSTPEDLPQSMVTHLAKGLRLPFVALDLRLPAERFAASCGERGGHRVRRLALRHDGATVGYLLVVGEGPSGAMGSRTYTALTDLLPQIAAGVSAVVLARELRESRDHLLTVRSQERQWIQRDLHDGLGPTLAAIGVQADLAKALLAAKETPVHRILQTIKEQSQQGVGEVRRIVHGLNPRVLDELGLAAALTDEATALSASDDRSTGGVTVTVDVPQRLPPLPTETAVAAYRIACEAMTNAARHSSGHQVTITVRVIGSILDVTVLDDGRGLVPPVAPGTGLISIRERAAAAGGTCVIENRTDHHGTMVHARLPLVDHG